MVGWRNDHLIKRLNWNFVLFGVIFFYSGLKRIKSSVVFPSTFLESDLTHRSLLQISRKCKLHHTNSPYGQNYRHMKHNLFTLKKLNIILIFVFFLLWFQIMIVIMTIVWQFENIIFRRMRNIATSHKCVSRQMRIVVDGKYYQNLTQRQRMFFVAFVVVAFSVAIWKHF